MYLLRDRLPMANLAELCQCLFDAESLPLFFEAELAFPTKAFLLSTKLL